MLSRTRNNAKIKKAPAVLLAPRGVAPELAGAVQIVYPCTQFNQGVSTQEVGMKDDCKEIIVDDLWLEPGEYTDKKGKCQEELEAENG